MHRASPTRRGDDAERRPAAGTGTEPHGRRPSAARPTATTAPATCRRRSTRTATARSCSASPPPVPPTTARTTRPSSTPPRSCPTENGFGEPIVVDNIQAADAATAIGDLAQQGVDVIIVGASEIAEPLPQLIAEYPDIFWYCNCGAGFPEDPGLAQSTDDGGEIGYTAGYATGLMLQEQGGDSVGVHRLLRPRLREAGVPGVRARPAGGRPGVHDDLRADRRLPVRLRQHRQRHRGAADRDRRGRRRRVPVPRRRPPPGGAGRQRGRPHHDERRVVDGVRPTRGARLRHRRASSTAATTCAPSWTRSSPARSPRATSSSSRSASTPSRAP